MHTCIWQAYDKVCFAYPWTTLVEGDEIKDWALWLINLKTDAQTAEAKFFISMDWVAHSTKESAPWYFHPPLYLDPYNTFKEQIEISGEVHKYSIILFLRLESHTV